MPVPILLKSVVSLAFSELVKSLVQQKVCASTSFKFKKWVQACDKEVTTFASVYVPIKAKLDSLETPEEEKAELRTQLDKLLAQETELKHLPVSSFDEYKLSVQDAALLEPILEA